MAERYSAVVYLAAGCGLRAAEITGLEVGSLDFLRREVDIAQQLVCVTGQDPYLGPPKTKTSARAVELPAITAAALARHIEMFPPVEVEIWDRTNPDRRKHHRRQADVHQHCGATDPPSHLDVHVGTSGPEGERPERYGHPLPEALLRHTADPQRASVKRVQLALGHSTPTITLNTYVGE
jgi:integrase